MEIVACGRRDRPRERPSLLEGSRKELAHTRAVKGLLGPILALAFQEPPSKSAGRGSGVRELCCKRLSVRRAHEACRPTGRCSTRGDVKRGGERLRRRADEEDDVTAHRIVDARHRRGVVVLDWPAAGADVLPISRAS
jgi:hypothetical protein